MTVKEREIFIKRLEEVLDSLKEIEGGWYEYDELADLIDKFKEMDHDS